MQFYVAEKKEERTDVKLQIVKLTIHNILP